MANPRKNESAINFVSTVPITMDYDSGYISQNTESNLDSSLESNSQIMSKYVPSKTVYLSEDALLETPDVKRDYHNISFEIEKEDYEETRTLFYSSEIETSNTEVPSSVASQSLSYSGLNDTESDVSDVSSIIPVAKSIVSDDYCFQNHEYETNNSRIHDEHENNFSYVTEDENCFFGKLEKKCKQTKPPALNNITNTISTNESSKRLTLVFSKEDKENVYSVKRKYRSLTPPESVISPTKRYSTDSFENGYSSRDVTKSSAADCSELDRRELESKQLDYCSVIPTQICFPKVLTPEELASEEKHSSTNTCFILNPPCSKPSCEKESKDNSLQNSINPIEADFDSGIVVLKEDGNIERAKTEVKENSILNNKEILDVQSQNSVAENPPKTKLECDSLVTKSEGDLLLKSNKIDVAIACKSSLTPEKAFVNAVNPNVSPDLFEDDELVHNIPPEICTLNFIANEKYVSKQDQLLVRRAQNSLKGVFPPLSVTIVQMSINEILNRIESNKEYFWTFGRSKLQSESTSGNFEAKSFLVSESGPDYRSDKFPQILERRFHGLHYNRSKLSENFEDLCSKYAQRYVGSETQSTCTIFEPKHSSPMKRRQIKQRWNVKSPGRRLSHLAKRRITFSSTSLQAGASVLGSRTRQILVDAKKLDLLRRKSPRKSPRKTPRKSPRGKTRTPSSSAKKKLAMRFRKVTGEIETTAVSSTKRALFQSPDKDKKSNLFMPSTSGISVFEKDIKKPTKRALFVSPKRSPFKKSPFKRLDLNIDRKRKRSESDDLHPLVKLPRSMSESYRTDESAAKTLNRSQSEISIGQSQNENGELSMAHKKKLQWAVYEALATHNIKPFHAQFKLFASILARVTRRLLPYYNMGKEVSTSERMLRITKYHVYAVMKGRSVDDIVSEYLKSKLRISKPHGYVGIGEFEAKRLSVGESVLQDRANVMGESKRKMEGYGKPPVVNRNIDRIRKVINFGDDNR